MHFSALVAIGWLYVTVLMALTQPTVLAGIATLLFYGLLPVGILLYVFTAPVRKRLRLAREAAADTAASAPATPNTAESDAAPAAVDTDHGTAASAAKRSDQRASADVS